MAQDSMPVMQEILGSLLVGLEYLRIASLSYAEHIILCEDIEFDRIGAAVIHFRCADAFVPIDRTVTLYSLTQSIRKHS